MSLLHAVVPQCSQRGRGHVGVSSAERNAQNEGVLSERSYRTETPHVPALVPVILNRRGRGKRRLEQN